MINTEQIPDTTQLDVAATAYSSAKKFFEDPENMKAYEKWAEERRNPNA